MSEPIIIHRKPASIAAAINRADDTIPKKIKDRYIEVYDLHEK